MRQAIGHYQRIVHEEEYTAKKSTKNKKSKAVRTEWTKVPLLQGKEGIAYSDLYEAGAFADSIERD